MTFGCQVTYEPRLASKQEIRKRKEFGVTNSIKTIHSKLLINI